MRKIAIFTLALLLSASVYGQNVLSGNGIQSTIETHIVDTNLFVNNRWMTQDTIPVLGYCIDPVTLKTHWRKLYAIQGWNKPCINMNGLMLYQTYLMPDRKTPVSYKVVYAINH